MTLSKQLKSGRIVLIGPQQNPYPELLSLPNLSLLPAMPLMCFRMWPLERVR